MPILEQPDDRWRDRACVARAGLGVKRAGDVLRLAGTPPQAVVSKPPERTARTGWARTGYLGMTGQQTTALAEFVIRRLLDPVMRARPDGRSSADRELLSHVQDATRAEIERFRNYGSDEEVALRFSRDLDSAPVQKVQEQLRRLGLPTLDAIQEDFKQEIRRLGVSASTN